jgi:hypothetical protein
MLASVNFMMLPDFQSEHRSHSWLGCLGAPLSHTARTIKKTPQDEAGARPLLNRCCLQPLDALPAPLCAGCSTKETPEALGGEGPRGGVKFGGLRLVLASSGLSGDSGPDQGRAQLVEG